VGENYLGIPRGKIYWFPTINLDKCISCLACVDRCLRDVFRVEGNPPKPVVTNPYNCLVGCESCAKLCPTKAIFFPPRKEFKLTIRKLRERYPL